jgi:hypothetical protein
MIFTSQDYIDFEVVEDQIKPEKKIEEKSDNDMADV